MTNPQTPFGEIITLMEERNETFGQILYQAQLGIIDSDTTISLLSKMSKEKDTVITNKLADNSIIMMQLLRLQIRYLLEGYGASVKMNSTELSETIAKQFNTLVNL